MKFGDLIGRVSEIIRDKYSNEPGMLFSVKGMKKTELMKIQQEGPGIFDLIKPILLDYDHLLMEAFIKNPKMTPGEIREHFLNQFNFILNAISAELRIRK